jgi:hypothetical protein
MYYLDTFKRATVDFINMLSPRLRAVPSILVHSTLSETHLLAIEFYGYDGEFISFRYNYSPALIVWGALWCSC